MRTAPLAEGNMGGTRADRRSGGGQAASGGVPTRGEGLVLSAVAGSVDGLGYVLLHVFTAHITGNTVHLGTDAGRLELAAAARPAVAIAAFIAGVGLGAVVREACLRRGVPARAAVIALSGALLAAFLAVGAATGGTPFAEWRFCALTAPAALAMGCQNAVMPKVGERRVRTYITGTMTELAEALVAAATGPRGGRARELGRAARLFEVWATYLAGGIVSGVVGTRWGIEGALVPIGGIALVVAVELRRWRAGELVAQPAQ